MHIFAPPTPFDDGGEYFSDWTSPSQIVAGIMAIVSFAALTLTLCHALTILLSEAFALPNGFGPPPSLHPMLLV
jgi:hypothetical protein